MDMSNIYGSYFDTAISNAKTTASTSNAARNIKGLSSESTDEELENAVKSFEQYFVEQVIKEVKESMSLDDKDDSTISKYTDLYMDSAISKMAEYLVNDIGSDLTSDLVAQMKRNYGIE